MKERIEDRSIKLEYIESDEMLADCLTKPIMGTKFTQWRKKMMNE